MGPAPDLLDRRLLLVTGKGGVGKSTMAAATAMLAADRGRRVLLVDVDGKGDLATLFEHAPVGFSPVQVHPGDRVVGGAAVRVDGGFRVSARKPIEEGGLRSVTLGTGNEFASTAPTQALSVSIFSAKLTAHWTWWACRLRRRAFTRMNSRAGNGRVLPILVRLRFDHARSSRTSWSRPSTVQFVRRC